MQLSDDQIISVFDVETTGLSANTGDRICEVGIVRAQGDVILETYTTLVNPQRPISPGAAQVNGLSDAQVSAAPLFAQIAGEVLERIDGTVLVCHNAPFDLSFLDAELSRLGLRRQIAGVIDTLEIARRNFRFPSNSLSSIARYLQIRNIQAHRALGDALTTYHVLRSLQRQLDERAPAGRAPAGRGPSVYPPPIDISVPAGNGNGLLPPEIREALTSGHAVEITYLDGRGSSTRRQITPVRVREYAGVLHLVAYCHLRQAERSFRLDRIVVIKAGS